MRVFVYLLLFIGAGLISSCNDDSDHRYRASGIFLNGTTGEAYAGQHISLFCSNNSITNRKSEILGNTQTNEEGYFSIEYERVTATGAELSVMYNGSPAYNPPKNEDHYTKYYISDSGTIAIFVEKTSAFTAEDTLLIQIKRQAILEASFEAPPIDGFFI